MALSKIDNQNVFIGNTVVYLRSSGDEKLYQWHDKFMISILKFQTHLKCWYDQKHFKLLRIVTCSIQKICRFHLKTLTSTKHIDTSAFVDSVFNHILDETSDGPTEYKQKATQNTSTNNAGTQYRFVKFAHTYFNPENSHKYTSSAKLSSPLLKLEDKQDEQAAIACWNVLQQLMHRGDASASFYRDDYQCSECSDNVESTQTRGLILDQIKYAFSGKSSFLVNCNTCRRNTGKSLRLKTKIPPESLGQQKTNNKNFNPFMPNRKMSSLDQQHFIIGMGIVRPTLRDEIYCQVMKQLTGNNIKKSYARGWLLLAHLLSTFIPSKLLYPYVEEFIRLGPGCLSEFCYQRLQRTKQNGNRSQPPSWLEMHATKMKRSYMTIGITLMDGSAQNVHLDPSSNSKEVIKSLSRELGLIDNFGFSIFIAVLDKVSSLGAGNDHILDAISNCEQYCREKMGITERNASWRLFFRKEIFAPWHNPSKDAVSTNLIYHQICRGIRYGEYRCGDKKKLYTVISKIFIIECGNYDALETFVPALLPEETNDPLEDIERLRPFVQSLIKKPQSSITLKENLVSFAQTNWPLLFSRFFEASLENHDGKPTILAINWIGLSIIADDAFANGAVQLVHVSYPQILAVSANVSPVKCIFIHTTKSPSRPLKIYSSDAVIIRELLVYFLNRMRAHSKYFVATDDYSPHIFRGDLLEFVGNVNQINTVGNLIVRKDKYAETLSVPSVICHRLATVNKPSLETLEDFRVVTNKEIVDADLLGKTTQLPSSDESEVHLKTDLTLQEYSKHKFNRSNNCVYQNTPINKALLKQICNSSLELKAVHLFELILHYTEQDPSFENVESIIQTALCHPLIRDECYCQLLKQLNGSKCLTENRLWEVMWLLTGCCAPYCPTLDKTVETYLRMRSKDATSLAFECLQRFSKTKKRGSRKFPPTHIEFEAIQKGTTEIFHRIYLPDGTEHILEIESSSRAKDVCIDIMKKLRITRYPVNNFALYVSIASRIVIVPPSEFFFDFLRSIIILITKAPNNVTYQAVFRRKLWINVIPGQDPECDIHLHFPHEKENFLAGYHDQLGIDTVKSMAAVLHLINCCEHNNFDMDFEPSQCIPKSYVSKNDYLKNDVQQRINKMKSTSTISFNVTTLKTDFIRTLSCRSKLFGYTVFKITRPKGSETANELFKSSPVLYLAVGESGVFILDPNLYSEIIAYYPYKQLTNWTSGSCYFHLTIGDLISGRKLLFETPLGYRIDDLLTSYVSILIEQQLTGIGKQPCDNSLVTVEQFNV